MAENKTRPLLVKNTAVERRERAVDRLDDSDERRYMKRIERFRRNELIRKEMEREAALRSRSQVELESDIALSGC